MVLSSLQCTGQPHSREPPDPGISPAPAQEAGLSLRDPGGSRPLQVPPPAPGEPVLYTESLSFTRRAWPPPESLFPPREPVLPIESFPSP